MNETLISLIKKHDGHNVSYDGKMCVLYVDEYGGHEGNELWITLNNIETGKMVMHNEHDIACSLLNETTNVWTIGGNTLNLLDDSKTWKVTIEAKVRKDITVKAESEQEATEKAHELFTVASETDIDEAYEEQTVSIKKVI